MPRLPPMTVRLRLTLLYGALFLVSGVVLLAIAYVLFRRATGINLVVLPGASGQPDAHVREMAERAYANSVERSTDALHQGLLRSGIALGVMTAVSIALGWLVAGRVLRPLRAMTAATRQISERNLHERLALPGPGDELKDLADTVDSLLARLETAFGAQQRFVANAAHELRTPLTLWRALLEETLTDPDATIDSFRATSRRLLALGDEQERLLESLLTLASSERGLDRREPFDLAAVVDATLREPPPAATSLDLRIESELEPAPAAGDAALAERLVRNLIDNAAHYNVRGGRLQVRTGAGAGGAFLAVANDGAVIPTAAVERLFEPFQRLGTDRTAPGDGHNGLGLSIVGAIATAHRATVRAEARPEGGLAVEVRFPAAAEPEPPAPAGDLAGVPVYCSWSGGKDSALALHHALRRGAEPGLLVTMLTEGGERSRSHGLRRELLEAQAAALGVPIAFAATTWAGYEEALRRELTEAAGRGLRTGIFGDIDIERHRGWVESVAEAAGTTASLPLWQRSRETLMHELLELGFRAVIVAVKDGALSPSLLGQTIDEPMLRRFAAAGVDLAGENGEFHTFVVDGPPFSRPVEVDAGDASLRDGVWFIDLAPSRVAHQPALDD